MRDPLAIPALALAVGVVASSRLEFTGPAPLATCALLGVAAIGCRWRGFRIAALAAVAGAFWAGGILVERWHRPGKPPVIDHTPGEMMILEGCVVEPPSDYPGKEQFVLELARGARVRVSVYLNEGEPPPNLRYGQRVEMEARLRQPHNYRNPGAFDHVRYLARKQVFWTASANAKSRLEVRGTCGNAALAMLYSVREAALERLDRLYPEDTYSNAMSRAVLLGDASRMERVWADDFRKTGTYHALVISGLHLTTMAACLLFLVRVCGLGLGWSLGATVVVSWCYALMVGATAPVVRAAVGLTLYQAGVWFHRRPRVLNLLGATAILFLLVDPEQLFDVSFQLTFLAVAMIAAVAGPWLESSCEPYRRGSRSLAMATWDRYLPPSVAAYRLELRLIAQTLHWLLRLPMQWGAAALSMLCRAGLLVWGMLAVSAIVQVGMALPMVLYFHRVSLSGLTANLLIVPMMNAMVPVGFLAIATGWGWVAGLAAKLLAWSQAVAQWHAAREPALRIPDPPEWLVWVFLAALALAAWSMLTDRRWPVLAFAAAWLTVVAHPFAPRVDQGILEATAIDVGQGDCLLVVSPEGRTMLIDSGGIPRFRNQKRTSTFDVGEQVVSDYLFTRSFRHVDVLVLTHAHEDHTGGAKSLVENFRPAEIWTGAMPDASEIEKLGVPVRSPRAGEAFPWGGTTVRVLSPPRDYSASAQARNNDSLAFRIDYGRRGFLFTGDIERAMEDRMLADGLAGPADVLKVAHHGSRTSSTAGFLDAVRPVYGVISDGIDNSFRHPHPDVVGRLDQRRVTTWRTDRHGLVVFRTDGRRLEVQPFVWGGGRLGPLS
jgi:competence protein ComEC